MFTGIIEKVAQVTRITEQEGGCKIVVATTWKDLSLGESIAVNGCCLTVAEILTGDGDALFFLSPETLARTNLHLLREDARVNLERAMVAGARLSGHIVQGHVDGPAYLAGVQEQEDCHLIEFDLPPSISRYCVEKGSIALNGVSLTINQIEERADGARISITLIPHTWEHTNFKEYRPGDPINAEVDVLAKYVEKLCQPNLKTSGTRSSD